MARSPIFTAKYGSVWLAVHPYEFTDRGVKRKQYRFSYSEHGKTKHVTATSFDRIKTLAKERAKLIYEGKTTEPSPAQSNELLEQCRIILGGTLESIVPACRHYAQTVLAVTHTVTIGQSFGEYMEYRKPLVTKDRYVFLKKIQRMLNLNAYCYSIDSTYIDDLVKSVKGGQRTKYSHYSVLGTWLRWAEKKGHIADAEKLLNRVTNKGEKTEGKREVFTADELKRLMNAATPEVQQIFALCAFGGLRKSEALRVRWEQIDFNDNVIRLEGPQVKTQTRRAVRILPTLKKWLLAVPASERTGKVWGKGEKGYFYHQTTICKKAGVNWKNNGLRHTAISARCCNGTPLGEVADWAGNSVPEIKKHYLALISTSDANAWWQVLPSGTSTEPKSLLDTLLEKI